MSYPSRRKYSVCTASLGPTPSSSRNKTSQPFVRGERLRDIASGREGAHQQQLTGLPERGQLDQLVTWHAPRQVIPHLRALGKLPHTHSSARIRTSARRQTPRPQPTASSASGKKRPPGDDKALRLGAQARRQCTHSNRRLCGVQHATSATFDVDRCRLRERQDSSLYARASTSAPTTALVFRDQRVQRTASIGWLIITPQRVERACPERRAVVDKAAR